MAYKFTKLSVGEAVAIDGDFCFKILGMNNSTDAAIWTVSEYIGNGILTCFLVDDKWVIFAKMYDDAYAFVNTNIYTSTNGKDWELIGNLPVALTTLIYGNGLYVGYNGTTVYCSNDLLNWSTTAITLSVSSYIFDLVYGGGRFLLIPNNGLEPHFYSDDGVTWTQLSSKIGNDTLYTAIEYLNGTWFASWNGSNAKSGSVFYRSTDAINWTKISDVIGTIYRPTYYDGLYTIPVRKSSSDPKTKDYYYSHDGISWTVGTVIGDTGNNITIENAGGMWFARNYYSGTYYSRDGINWSPTNVTDWYLQNIVYGNGIFVASTKSNGMMFSTDGVNWEQSNITDIALAPKYANNIFIASTSSKGIWYSSDGKMWIQSNITVGSVIGYGCGTWVGKQEHAHGWSNYTDCLVYFSE